MCRVCLIKQAYIPTQYNIYLRHFYKKPILSHNERTIGYYISHNTPVYSFAHLHTILLSALTSPLPPPHPLPPARQLHRTKYLPLYSFIHFTSYQSTGMRTILLAIRQKATYSQYCSYDYVTRRSILYVFLSKLFK